jgi:hypothetical protein
MSVLTLPLTRFSAKILLHERGSQPLRIAPRGDSLAPSLLSASMRLVELPEHTVSIEFDVPEAFRLHIQPRVLGCAAALHALHKEQMLRFAWAMSLAGWEVKKALAYYMALHRVDEEDYPMENALRAWQRFNQEKKALFSKKSVRSLALSVLKTGRDKMDGLTKPPELPILYANEKLDALFALVKPKIAAAWKNVPEHVLLQVHIYIYAVRGGRNYKRLQERFKRSERRLRNAKRRVQGYLDTDPNFRAAMYEVFLPSVLSEGRP